MSVALENINQVPETFAPSDEHFCRYLGLVALFSEKQTSIQHLEQQVITELAESLDAEMGTHSEPIRLTISDGELCDSEGRSMSRSAAAWSGVQSLRASRDPRLAWFARIAQTEATEHDDVLSFAQTAEVGETLTIISPFPEEAYNDVLTRKSVADEGFRPDIKRAFIRIYEKTNSGINEHIQSVDSSSLAVWNKSLSEVFGAQNAETTEQILQSRFKTKNAKPQELIERITVIYDALMSQRDHGKYRYGRNPGGSVEANTFVREHMDIVQNVIQQLQVVAESGHVADAITNRILYENKALLSSVLKDGKQIQNVLLESQAAGMAAAAEGITFYGCSGASGAFAEQAAKITHEMSFSLMNGLEGVAIKQCPKCGKECFTAIRDKRSGQFYCTNKNCSGYSAEKVQAAYGVNSTSDKTFTEIFADALIALFATKKVLPHKSKK